MKRIDYYWPRAAVKITGIVFLSQIVMEVSGIASRKPEFWWVIYACTAAFAASIAWSVLAVLINTWCAKFDG